MAYIRKGNKIGDWVITSKRHESLSGIFTEGSKVKIIGIDSMRGYHIEDEYGNKMYDWNSDLSRVQHKTPNYEDHSNRFNLNEVKSNNSISREEYLSFLKYKFELNDLIGDIDYITEKDLIEKYGITKEEYLKPTIEVIDKVKKSIEENNNIR